MNNQTNTSTKYKCDNCSIARDTGDFADVSDADIRFSVGSPFTDKECPDCGALAYPVTVIETAEHFKSEATAMLEQLAELASNALIEAGNTAEESQLVAFHIATKQLEKVINGVEDSDLINNEPKVNNDTFLNAILTNAHEDCGGFQPNFVTVLDKSNWHEFKENGDHPDLEFELRTSEVTDTDCISINVHLVFYWGGQMFLNFGSNEGDEFIPGHVLNIHDLITPSLTGEELKSLFVSAYSDNVDAIQTADNNYADTHSSDITSALEELAGILGQTPE
ncbi:hypothetical protein [Moritella sp. F3]|uniref:hypothetical protein n=1 Tax=Moritella sp. F3 TaxID=2718882 RepID=UPI0018E191B2|nr:hypothetical protein [Moritella sp. F3]GIC77082.1 hypothetical protein FMO001_18090 [Moritella sp. F1]GIC82201.1 hypothetical protein FMO003_24820 [Moritella sp. F3]